MADIINATIDDKQFEVYVRMMKERSENLKPVLAAAGNHLIGALFKPGENIDTGTLIRSVEYEVRVLK